MTQEESLAIMDDGNSVLLTGAAGTGKTYTLNQFVRMSRSKGKTIALTATTGLAATHINGTTIHSWSGLGINDTIPPNFVDNLTNQRVDIIRSSDILIIDEISMMHHWRLDMIDKACQLVRESELPFGGLQVILAGDFFQLPPINRADSKYGGFITESDIWQNDHFVTCYLTEQFRQKEDQAYTEILNGIRAGFLSSRQIQMLKSKIGAPLPVHEASTRLLTTNVDVDKINEVRLSELPGEEFTYEMVTTGPKKYVEQLKNACLATEYLKLKIGAFVMCIKNSTDKKFVNGSLGVVAGFEASTHYPIVKLNNGRQVTLKPDTWELQDGPKKRASLSQIPLRLAWAITIHKSQGMTLDNAKIDLSKAFVEGMGYVALSRVKNINNLSLDGLNNMAFQVSREAKKINSELIEASQQAVNIYARQIKNFKLRVKEVEPITVTKKSKMTWSEKLAKMRQEYPNAYLPWTEKDDKKLIETGQKIGKNHDIYFHADTKLRSRVQESTIDIFYDQASQDSFSPEVQLLAKKAIKRAVNIEANQYLPSRLESVASSMDCGYKSLTIKPMKSRWGSCSSKQEIKLNCYLMFMPWEVIDYVLVHELSHTKHLNHSSLFWQMVEESLPDYKARKKTLKIMQAEVSDFQI